MRLRVLAVGKAPPWIDEGFASYAQRLPPDNALELVVVTPRTGQSDGERLLAAVRAREVVVVLDRCGRPLSSEGLATLLADWRMGGRDIALLVGGADGFDARTRENAEYVISLSQMTFPHLLVRVLIAEQIYRAWSILAGHPYHR